MRVSLKKIVGVGIGKSVEFIKELILADTFVPIIGMTLYFNNYTDSTKLGQSICYFEIESVYYDVVSNSYFLVENDNTIIDKFSFKLRYPTENIENEINEYLSLLEKEGWKKVIR